MNIHKYINKSGLYETYTINNPPFVPRIGEMVDCGNNISGLVNFVSHRYKLDYQHISHTDYGLVVDVDLASD
jgi:hypothetical protein